MFFSQVTSGLANFLETCHNNGIFWDATARFIYIFILTYVDFVAVCRRKN